MDFNQERGLRAEATHELVRWILTEGRTEAVGEDPAHDPSPLASSTGSAELLSAGVPLWRVTIYAATLHRRFAASAGAGGVVASPKRLGSRKVS
jgi:hypothetical protein